jgi:hypothetical protein
MAARGMRFRCARAHLSTRQSERLVGLRSSSSSSAANGSAAGCDSGRSACVCARRGVRVCVCAHTGACVCVCASRVRDVCPSRVCAGWGGGGGDTTHRSMVWVPGARVVHLEAPALHCGGDAPLACACHTGRGKDRQGGELAGACTRVCARVCVWRLAGAACHPTALCVRAHKQPEHQSCLPAWRPCHAHMHGRMPQQCMRRPIRPTRIPLHCTHDSPACAH